jgi:hypothetical protein
VEIMQDRLTATIQQLMAEGAAPRPPAAAAAMASAGPEGPPSDAMRAVGKQLLTLRNVLVPILLNEEVEYIFGRWAHLQPAQPRRPRPPPR